jgi:hypothetical protein
MHTRDRRKLAHLNGGKVVSGMKCHPSPITPSVEADATAET